MTSTDKLNYWSLLGIEPGSNAEQLKRAFRKEARKWHPDLNGNDQHAEERFKLVNEAYAVLSDPQKRQLWENNSLRQTSSIDPFAKGFPSFEEYIEAVLGVENSPINNDEYPPEEEYISSDWPTPAPSQPPPVQVYEDQETVIRLSPEQALYGSSVEVDLIDGRTVEIETPPFSGDGWRLRLAGVAKGGRDHFLQLKVQTEEGLRIDGLRVFYKLELTPSEAVLGCAIDVPTLSGPVTLQVPPRSSSGRLLRLRGRGLEYENLRGDQLVEIVIVIPANLSDSEEALYLRLQQLELEN